MNSKIYKKFLHGAHLGSAVIVGMAISGMDAAPIRVIVLSGIAFIFLLVSYDRIYLQPNKNKPSGNYQPWDQEARDRLGLDD